MRKLIPVICLLAFAALVAPAPAIVGGQRVAPSAVPWFVGTGIYGGTLIAADCIATAAHCLDPVEMTDLERIQIAGETRRGVRVSLPPTWHTRRVGFALHDIAIVALCPAAMPARPTRSSSSAAGRSTRRGRARPRFPVCSRCAEPR